MGHVIFPVPPQPEAGDVPVWPHGEVVAHDKARPPGVARQLAENHPANGEGRLEVVDREEGTW